MFHHIKDDSHLEFDNYPLSEKQIKPMAFTLPFLSKLRSVKMRHCNLSDNAASIVINAIIGAINVKQIDLSGFEMGNNFLMAFRSAINYNPLFLEELTLEGLKNKSNIYSMIKILTSTRNL